MRSKFLAFLTVMASLSPVFCLVQTHEVALASATIVVVNVSSGTAVQMDTSTNLLTGRFAVEIFNDDATDNLFCGFSSTGTVTTTAMSRRITARTAWVVQVGQDISIFCISDGAGGVSAPFTQLR